MQKEREKILIFFLAITIPYCKYFITRHINNTHARMWGREVSTPPPLETSINVIYMVKLAKMPLEP